MEPQRQQRVQPQVLRLRLARAPTYAQDDSFVGAGREQATTKTNAGILRCVQNDNFLRMGAALNAKAGLQLRKDGSGTERKSGVELLQPRWLF